MDYIPFPQIVGPTYTLASKNAACQRCVNLYLETIETGENGNSYYLRETPGLLLQNDIGGGPSSGVQGMHKCANGRVFAVTGNILWEIFVDTQVQIGVLSLEINYPPIRFSDNTLQMVMVLGNNVQNAIASYTFATGAFTTFDAIDQPAGFIGSSFIAFMNQYFITLVVDASGNYTQQFQISPLSWAAGTAWDAADVFSAESNPDNLNALVVNGSDLWLFGPNSYEVWFNSTDPQRPFQRNGGAAYAIGCAAQGSVLAFQTNVFWLGSSKEGYGIVWMSQGYQAKRISTTAIEIQIQSYANISDAIAWTYQNAGHSVYVISFPSVGTTFAYDLQTDMWHELSYRDPLLAIDTQHRGACQVFAFGKNLVGDYADSLVYELSTDVYTDNTAPINRYRRAPVIKKGQREVIHHRLELDMQVGVGLNPAVEAATSTNPLISMRYSDDNGYTWSNYHVRSLGRVGNYSQRVVFNRLGSALQRVYEVYFDAPVPFRIIDAELGVAVGAH